MFCINCAARILPNAKFCAACGAPVDKGASADASPQGENQEAPRVSGDREISMAPQSARPMREAATRSVHQTGQPSSSGWQCPKCRLTNSWTALHCDCGYDFRAGTTSLSLKAVAANFLGIVAVTYLTSPFRGEPDWLIDLFARLTFMVVTSAVITGVFWLFRREKETRLLMRSFIIAAWVILGLTILGTIS